MSELVQMEKIEKRIFTIRGVQVMLDRDLAELYGVETKVLNQAVKRNIARFPATFRFQLRRPETEQLVTNCDRFSNLKHSSVFPFVFNEQGVAMLSAVLHSETAIQTSIQIIDAFVKMRQFLANNADFFMRLESVEKRQQLHEMKVDDKFEQLFIALEGNNIKPKKGIFYDGQVFDAYAFVCDLIRSAKQRIILIDNYVDESVLTLLSKRDREVSTQILTNSISKAFALDIEKFNRQYPSIDVQTFKSSHDRFLIIDDDIYHIGASLKDLGKKWFAFAKMDVSAIEMLQRVSV